MDARYIALAIPFFFLLIGIELLVCRARGLSAYRLHDAVSSLSCGVGQQVIGVFATAFTFAAYDAVQRRFGVFAIAPSSPGAWVAILLGVDLGYYIEHRANHRVNALWATHAVHHQSEDYNLATALRQEWASGLLVWWVYLPLAAVGFPATMWVTAVTVNTLYQFWIHTRTVKRLGPLEWILNTPSHHRVHHGVDPKYIDKNYAGMLIVWDRLFGTFAEEEEEPVYGTVKPLASFNAWWANAAEWARIAALSRSSRRLRDKLYAWIAPPEWRPADLGGPVVVPEVDRAAYRKHEVVTTLALDLYVVFGFLLVAASTTAYLWFAPDAPRAELAAAGTVILVTLLAWGGLAEGKRWAVPLELARLVAVVAVVALLARGSAGWSSLVGGAAALSLAMAIWVVKARAGGEPTAIAGKVAAG